MSLLFEQNADIQNTSTYSGKKLFTKLCVCNNLVFSSNSLMWIIHMNILLELKNKTF